MNSQGRGEELIVLYDVISPHYEPILYIHGVNIQTDCDCENMFIFFAVSHVAILIILKLN